MTPNRRLLLLIQWKVAPSLKKKHTSPFFVSLLNYERYVAEIQRSHSSLLCNCYHCYFPQKKRSVMLFYHERQKRRKNYTKQRLLKNLLQKQKLLFLFDISCKFIYYFKLFFYTTHCSLVRSLLGSINICRDKQKQRKKKKLFFTILSLKL